MENTEVLGAAGFTASCSENLLTAWIPGFKAGGSAPRQPHQGLFSFSSWQLLGGGQPENCECSWRGDLPAAPASAGEARPPLEEAALQFLQAPLLSVPVWPPSLCSSGPTPLPLLV